MFKIVFILLTWTSGLWALPNFGNRTDEYQDCVRQCEYVYNPEYLQIGAELVRLVEWYQHGRITDEEYKETRVLIETALEHTMPLIRRSQQ